MIEVNSQKGDTPFEAGGRTYVLRYSHRSLVLLEDKLGKGVMKIMKEIDEWSRSPEEMRLGMVCTMLWAGLQKHHPGLSSDEVLDIVDDLDGGIAKAVELLGESFQRAFNAPGTKGTNPPQQTEGTGTGANSSSTSQASASNSTNSGTSRHANTN